MHVKGTHMNHSHEQTGLRCRTFIAMTTAVAAMMLAGAKPTFAHGEHIGAPGPHNGGKLYCSAGTGTPVTVTPPEVGPVTNAVGERVWWTHALAWFNSGTGQWQWLEAVRSKNSNASLRQHSWTRQRLLMALISH
jgi:hypothetical protein